jgi:hypothetical protein
VRTDGVIFADFVQRGGYLYLQWRCPACESIGSVEFEEGTDSFRVFCSETGREFVVLSCSILLAECDGGS